MLDGFGVGGRRDPVEKGSKELFEGAVDLGIVGGFGGKGEKKGKIVGFVLEKFLEGKKLERSGKEGGREAKKRGKLVGEGQAFEEGGEERGALVEGEEGKDR